MLDHKPNGGPTAAASNNAGKGDADLPACPATAVADVKPTVEISEDGLTARVTICAPAQPDVHPPSLDAVLEEIKRSGIAVELDPEGVAVLAKCLSKGKEVHDVVIARGTPPQHGKAGRFEATVNLGKCAGAVKEDGTIDFHERHAMQWVNKGDSLGRVILPEKGTPGMSVSGRILPAKDGAPARVTVGRNVTLAKGGTELHAIIDGIVVSTGDTLSVTDHFEIPGDVDYTVGNIRIGKGSLVVRGTIHGGFVVTCGGNLTVNDAIENATVEAGGDVIVRRGIVMRTEGHVKAGRNVVAHFAENAQIEAGGDVIIDNDITHCDIRAGGRVLATKGKGRIQGGTIHCTGGIEVNEIGSPLDVATMVVIGARPEGYEKLMEERQRLRVLLRRLAAHLGVGSDETILNRTPPPQRDNVADLLKIRSDTIQRLKKIIHIRAQHRAMLKRFGQVRLVVKRTAFPGTVVSIAGLVYQVSDPMTHCVFRYDPETDSICADPL